MLLRFDCDYVAFRLFDKGPLTGELEGRDLPHGSYRLIDG